MTIELLVTAITIWSMLFVVDIICTVRLDKSKREERETLEAQNKLMKEIIMNPEEKKIPDWKAERAVGTIKRYCEEHKYCEDCRINCSVMKHGDAPCYWTQRRNYDN